ncbi:MAG: radical SAM protein [Firmicutes bacterium]|nr:radical SAM protein [Bacillota bacterium]
MRFNMDNFRIEGTIYRPPVEADTFLLQITAGCTHNACRFCTMYREKDFHLIDESDVHFNLMEAQRISGIYKKPVKRIFLMDGDVFSLSADKLEAKIKEIRMYLPELEVISMYAAVRSIKTKSDEDLHRLQELGVNDLHIGYESGLDDVLAAMNKGTTVEDCITQVQRLKDAGIRHNATMILGLGGKGRGEESGLAAAEMINQAEPQMVRLMTLSIFDGCELAEDVKNGSFEEAGEKEILTEEKTILENLKLPDLHFWANHILNSTPVAGYVGQDREWMLERIEKSLEKVDDETFKKSFKRLHL